MVAGGSDQAGAGELLGSDDVNSGLIERDARCAACGYSLRGLRVGGACSECGEAITETALRQLVYEDRCCVRAMQIGAKRAARCACILPASADEISRTCSTWLHTHGCPRRLLDDGAAARALRPGRFSELHA